MIWQSTLKIGMEQLWIHLIHDENYKDTIEGQKLPVEHCIKGTNGWKLNSKIYEALFDKHNYYLKTKASRTFEKRNIWKYRISRVY